MEYLPRKSQRKNEIMLVIPQIKISYKKPPGKIENVNILIRWKFVF